MKIAENLKELNPIYLLLEKTKLSYIKHKKTEKGKKLELEKSYLDIDESIYNESDISVFEKKIDNLKTYNYIDISFLTQDFSLIPYDYFDENIAETILNLNSNKENNRVLRYNIIPQFKVAIVYYCDLTIDSFIELHPNKARITHTGFKFLTNISLLNSDGIFIMYYENYLEIAIILDANLILYNIFKINSDKDALNKVQSVVELTKKDSQNVDFFYFGEFNSGKKLISLIKDNFKSIKKSNSFINENFTTIDLI